MTMLIFHTTPFIDNMMNHDNVEYEKEVEKRSRNTM